MKALFQISSLNLKAIITLLGIVFLNTSLTFGQNKEDIKVYFETQEIEVVQGTTFTNFLVIKNVGQEKVNIQDFTPREKYPGLLLNPKADFTLSSGEEKRLPIKFIVNSDFLKLKSDLISFTLSYRTGADFKNLDVTFNILRKEDRSIAIYPLSRENYLNPAASKTSVFIFVENRSYSKRSIKLDIQSLPDGLEISPRQQNISLEGQEKRMVEVQVAVRKQHTRYPDYIIQVKATDLINNEKVGSSQINMVVLSSNRQMGRNVDQVTSNNFAELTYNEHSTGLNYFQLRGNTEFAVSENLYGRFNLNADYYTQRNLYNLNDTWLELEHKKSVLRLGNIQANDYDYSISGRGGKVKTNIGVDQEIEVFSLENNYSLMGTYFPQNKGSVIAGTKYSFGTSRNLNGKISYLFDHNPRRSIHTQVADFATSFSLNKQHHFRIQGALSHEKGLINLDQNSGASAGLNYDTKLDKWNFQSINSYATKSYAGLNRGAYFFNQRIDREFEGSKRAFLAFEQSQMQPEYLSYQNESIPPGSVENYPQYFYKSQAIKLGYQFAIQNWNFIFSPQVEQQKRTQSFNARELLAYRLESNISTTFGAHGIHLTSAYAYALEDRDSEWFHSLRTTLSYRFKGFSINGTAQWNPNNVIDLNSFYNTGRNFINYNFYSAYNFQVIRNTLSGSISAGVNYSELYENINNNISGHLEYKISNDWSATVYFNYTDYKSTQAYGYNGSNYQFRIGVKKHFSVSTAKDKHKVSFQLFEDKNFNGLLDKDEEVLANEVIKLDNYIAMTDHKGKVTFLNVPKGNYKLKINENVGARLMMDPTIEVDKNHKIKVGLVKNIRVKGNLSEVKQAYDPMETSATGIVVYAKSEEGEIHTALVNQNNEFEFFLKDGKYEIYIENDKYKFIHPKQTIEVQREGKAADLLFEYKKKDTTIKVKKF